VFVPTTAVAKGPDFDIKLKPDADLSLLSCPRFRKSRVEKAAEGVEVAKMLERGILEKSTSPFATNNVIMPKKSLLDGKSGGVRVTTDMRRLNSMTIGDAFPAEDVKELVAWLAGKKLYSIMDVRDGYWHVRIKAEVRYLTAVRTVHGLVQYVMMSMGLRKAAAHFQRLINSVYEGLRWTGAEGEDGLARAIFAAYDDDLSVGSMSVEEHLADLEATLARTLEDNQRFKLEKCKFGCREVEILGHKVQHGEIRPSDPHVQAIQNFREPSNVTELLRFLGLVNIFGNHVDHLADKASPLYAVLNGTCWNEKKQRKGHKVRIADWDIRWGSEQRQAFLELKDVLASPDFLAPPRDGAERKLVTDPSQYGLGVVLPQNEVERGWFPLGFASRKLKGAEVRWTVSEKECAAVIFGLKRFRHLLYGEEFTVVTDHKALAWLMSLTDPKDRLARWMLEAQSFAFAVEYSPGGGEWMVVPDVLSRDTFSKNIVYCGRCLEALCVLGDTSDRAKAGLNEEN
jgi:RNase H-like domain found in reverse transcriptase/Reverse transcriptase (RNA-dependent DNA polymerase)